MTKGMMTEERRAYIAGLARLLRAFEDFGEIKYTTVSATDGEYVKVTDIFGGACFLDVTGTPLDEIFTDISRIVAFKKTPKSLITDKDLMRQIARRF